MVDRRRIEELREKVAETIREIEELEREAADELQSPLERRASFRVIRGGKAVVLAPFAWLAARARDHTVAVATGSAAFVLGAIGTSVFVGADGAETQTNSPSQPVDSAFPTSPAVAPAESSKLSPGSTGGTREAGALSSPSSLTSPSPTGLGIGAPDLPLLPDVPLPSELALPSVPAVGVPPTLPAVPTVVPPPTSPLTEAEALQRCLALVPPPVDIDECVRGLLG
jgi:hypothetical protein